MKKIFAMLLALAMVFALVACSGGDNKAAEDKPIKIGVLVADVSGEEALGFRAYYENYIAKNYNVTFTYTEQLADAAAEKSAIEKFAAQGYDAILSLSSADRATQIETAAANKLYYAVVSGMLDDAQFEQYKSNEYFVGQVGPSMDTEFEAGYAMGKHFADQGVKTVGIYGAFIPNPMHVYRTAGVLAGLGCTYGGASDKDGIAGQLFGDQGVDMSKVACTNVQVIGYFQGFGDTTFDELFAIVGQTPDAFLSVGMATTFFADALNGAKIPYADIDSFTTGNAANMKDGTLVYLAGKYSSSIGPIFAATMNAVKGNPIRDENGNAISLSQNYLVATDSATFDSIFNGDKGDNPIFNKEALDKVIGKVSYSDFAALVASK
ncbi:MAG: sugar ABC transporter substrate-binding protein [Clostridia bacterium]|jgi:hypothetical protein|nr:sugar ABC transporter substrate-binding protein [Clostridia bacterium]